MTSGGVSRVTIVAPKTRIDLALPSDVAFADLLPTILRHAGRELADDPAASRGWALSQAGAPPLDPDKSPKQLEIRDGEMLYLRPSGDEFPEPIFDDVIDAVATATHNRAGRWKPSTTRTFGLVLGIISLIIGAAMVLFAGPPHLPSALVGLGVAVVLLGVATVLSRAFGDSRTGAIFGILALCYLGVSGLILLAGDRSLTNLAAPHVLISATAILLGSAIAIVGIADLVSVFLGTFVTATGLCLGALLCITLGASPAAAAAAVATLGYALIPSLPMFSFRLAGLPIPSIPSTPEQMRTDNETVAGARVLALSERSDHILGGLLGAIAVLGVGAGGMTATTGGRAGGVFALVTGLFLMARARWFISRRQRLPLLIAGAVILGVVLVGVFAGASAVTRLSAGLGCVVLVAAISVGFALASSRGRRSPVLGRMLDLAEMVLVLAIIPLAVWVCGLYEWVRSIRDL